MQNAKLAKLRAELVQTIEHAATIEARRNPFPTSIDTRAAVRLCKRRARLENRIADLEYDLSRDRRRRSC